MLDRIPGKRRASYLIAFAVALLVSTAAWAQTDEADDLLGAPEPVAVDAADAADEAEAIAEERAALADEEAAELEDTLDDGVDSAMAEAEDETDVFDDLDEPDDGESVWLRSAEVAGDVLVVRPLKLGKLIAGTGFVFPASVLAAPAGMDVREEVVDVFFTIPMQDLTEPQLGDI